MGDSVVARTERTDVVWLGGSWRFSPPRRVPCKELEPTWNIILLERLDKAAQSPPTLEQRRLPATRHVCELNYAPLRPRWHRLYRQVR